MKAILEGEASFNPEFTRKLFMCNLCEHCTSVCTTGIRLDRFWELAREEASVRGLTPPPVKFASESVRKLGDPFSIGKSSRMLWTEGIEDIVADRVNVSADTAYYLGCSVSLKHQLHDVARSMIMILEASGINYTLLGEKETCCGVPLVWAGEPEGVLTLVEQNIEALLDLGVKRVVFSCPSCISSWMNAIQMRRVTSKAWNLELLTSSQFIRQLIDQGNLKFEEQDMVTVTYHDSCISARVLDVLKEPREVIERIPGVYRVEMVPSEKETRCCGSHALVNMVDPHLAAQIAEMRLRDASVTPATKLVSECPRCLLAFDFATMTLGYNIDVVDIAQLVARSLKTKEVGDS